MKLKNIVFNFISNTVYYLIGWPILTFINKIFLGYKIIGKENLRKVQGGKVTISNHMHYLDCTMNGLMNFPNFVHFVTLESNFKIPVAGFLIKLLKAIPIPTDKSKKKHFYEYVSELLQEGETVHIYPEGELKLYNQNLMDFKKGAFVFAVENNVPVVPTVFVTTKPEGIYKYYKKKPVISQIILEPIYPDLSIPNKLDRIENMKKIAYTKMKYYIENPNILEEEETIGIWGRSLKSLFN